MVFTKKYISDKAESFSGERIYLRILKEEDIIRYEDIYNR